MKKVKLAGKLQLKKDVVTGLNRTQMNHLIGGAVSDQCVSDNTCFCDQKTIATCAAPTLPACAPSQYCHTGISCVCGSVPKQ